MLSIEEIYDLLKSACDNAQEDDNSGINVPGLGDVDLADVKKLKWNSITFKRRSKLWFVTGKVVMITLYSYEMAYLINNSDKQAIILEMKGEE
uniref:Uncharacterized protein n=1 Tax=Siphoviridae sp. ctLfk13 TaxID=2826251 RepID=A0A8S5N1E6_9CAUD|nr:MAG TPA: hypothetical protein [Siphoviridae sp. ctLfk13]